MNRISTLVCCTVAVLAGGLGFFGGTRWAEKADLASEVVAPTTPELNPAWQFTSQPETGPALIAGPNPLVPESPGTEANEPDVQWFPEAIGEGHAGEPKLLTSEQREMWRNQTGLSGGEADELFSIRQQLASESSEAESVTIRPEEIQPLSGISPVPAANGETSDEPGLLQLPPKKQMRPALPQGPLLPQNLELVAREDGSFAESDILAAARVVVRRNRTNAQTVGYRRQTLFVLRGPSSPDTDASGLELVNRTEAEGSAVKESALEPEQWVTRLDLRPGAIVETDDRSDIAIHSAGWLRFSNDAADGYTRCGILTVSENCLAVRTAAGVFPLEPKIALPEKLTHFEITESGEVSAFQKGQTESEVCGRITLVSFRSPAHLAWSPRGFYQTTTDSGDAFELEPKKVSIHQGYLEQSNFDEEADQELLTKIRGLTATNEP